MKIKLIQKWNWWHCRLEYIIQEKPVSWLPWFNNGIYREESWAQDEFEYRISKIKENNELRNANKKIKVLKEVERNGGV